MILFKSAATHDLLHRQGGRGMGVVAFILLVVHVTIFGWAVTVGVRGVVAHDWGAVGFGAAIGLFNACGAVFMAREVFKLP
ncbi:MAG: hypothetical protein AB1760_00430 [Pseudomonadota bacterium]